MAFSPETSLRPQSHVRDLRISFLTQNSGTFSRNLRFGLPRRVPTRSLSVYGLALQKTLSIVTKPRYTQSEPLSQHLTLEFQIDTVVESRCETSESWSREIFADASGFDRKRSAGDLVGFWRHEHSPGIAIRESTFGFWYYTRSKKSYQASRECTYGARWCSESLYT